MRQYFITRLQLELVSNDQFNPHAYGLAPMPVSPSSYHWLMALSVQANNVHLTFSHNTSHISNKNRHLQLLHIFFWSDSNISFWENTWKVMLCQSLTPPACNLLFAKCTSSQFWYRRSHFQSQSFLKHLKVSPHSLWSQQWYIPQICST